MSSQPKCPACGAPIAVSPEGGLAANCSACGKAWASVISSPAESESDVCVAVVAVNEQPAPEQPLEAPLVIDDSVPEQPVAAQLAPEPDVFLSVGPVEEATAQAKKLPDGPWFLETPEGLRFGPVSSEELSQWVAEGRVSLDCRLKRSPDLDVSPGDFFPGLKVPPRRPSHPPGVRVIRTQPSKPVEPKKQDEPPPLPSRPGELTFRASHRGFWVLLLAVCSWAACPILGAIAWAMATHDLEEMNSGRMDRAGEGETALGMWLGMAHVIVSAVILVIGLIGGALALALK